MHAILCSLSRVLVYASPKLLIKNLNEIFPHQSAQSSTTTNELNARNWRFFRVSEV